jgi:hypothetical protein
MKRSLRSTALAGVWGLLIPLLCWSQTVHITDADAAAHVGEHFVIEGTVAAVYTSRKGNTFLNFGAKYPNQDFAAVVFASSAGVFSNLRNLAGRRVRVTGVVRLYRGKPGSFSTRRGSYNYWSWPGTARLFAPNPPFAEHYSQFGSTNSWPPANAKRILPSG